MIERQSYWENKYTKEHVIYRLGQFRNYYKKRRGKSFSSIISPSFSFIKQNSGQSNTSPMVSFQIPIPGRKSQFFDFGLLIERWEDIVGKKMLEHCYPSKLKDFTLTILTSSQLHAQSLSFMHVHIKKKIIDLFPQLEKVIKRFYFYVSPSFFDEKKRQIQQEMKNFPLLENSPLDHAYSPLRKQLEYEARVNLELDKLGPEVQTFLSKLYIQKKLSKAVQNSR